jgi:hypothetical protein
MQYKGKELVEFTSDKNVAFNPAKKMLVWDKENNIHQKTVVAYLGGTKNTYKVKALYSIDSWSSESYAHCAEIPPVRTNWDVFCERYGTDKNEDLLKMAMFQGIGCRCCPAKSFCKKAKEPTCHDSFVRWAKSEAEEEK